MSCSSDVFFNFMLSLSSVMMIFTFVNSVCFRLVFWVLVFEKKQCRVVVCGFFVQFLKFNLNYNRKIINEN